MFNAFKANTLIAFTSVVLLLSSCNFSKETSESQPVTPPAPAPDAFTLSISNGTYNSGDVIQLELSFPKTLTVDESLGTPYLDFDLGGTT